MSAQKPPAPPSLVTLCPVQNPADLQEIDTTILPDGASCWVLNTNTLYRFFKEATPASGLLVPHSGPGAWQPTIGDALFTTTVAPGTGSPGTVGANDVVTQTYAPGTPLHATDRIFGVSVIDTGETPGFPDAINVYGTIDNTTTPGTPRLRLIFQNITTAPITVPDGLTYTALVWRPSPLP